MREEYLGITDAAERLGVSAKRMSQFFWEGKLGGEDSGVRRIAGRRIIPASYLPTIARIMGAEPAVNSDPQAEVQPIV
jgi:hypothetical protein